jgi:WXG100 family type VII secretion target
MTNYTVDSEAVASATARARSTVSRIQSEVQGLQSQLVALQSSWSGPAASAFQVVADEWRVTQSRVEQSLEAITIALEQAGQQYADVEASNAALFGR